ncbi:DMT family transporter [Psychromarinibacter sp. C21-152]|uniref:DMT family transporter n=1 Tax=Psychromarinibacter sediminicola TaxID=3033385 RepID=A0AAE3NUL7_9RHOB|nr:DMT family transporter [Psychromarinibacter sediminicola]MDF0600902.1 DMT family transporter [Psychromarinibacter sediminicola]
MERKDHIDMFGAVSLIGFTSALGLNQVVVKVVNGGLQPVFNAGLRSVLVVLCLLVWMRLRGKPVRVMPGSVPSGLAMGVVFAVEFLFLFVALDLTTVARTSVIFYSMPVWLALAAHLLVPGDRLTRRKSAGLALAMAGVAWALLDRPGGGEASLLGDMLALAAALGWASIALLTKISPFSRVAPEMQLMWQVAVSAPILMVAALFFGPFIRDFEPWMTLGIAFQVAVVAVGFLSWFWLLKFYPASGVASFSFVAPVVGVIFGWLLLGEAVTWSLWVSLALVAAGIVLINRPPRASAMSAQTGR